MQGRERFPEPSWVASDEDRHRFRLLIAAIYFSKAGTITDLATVLPVSAQALHEACKSGGIRAQHAKTLEETLGAELFPRAFFRPDIFE